MENVFESTILQGDATSIKMNLLARKGKEGCAESRMKAWLNSLPFPILYALGKAWRAEKGVTLTQFIVRQFVLSHDGETITVNDKDVDYPTHIYIPARVHNAIVFAAE
jgi:hypothetical protein